MDSEYLKMVLALSDDFFENWKWQVGDKGLNITEFGVTEIIFIGFIHENDITFSDCIIPNDGNFRAGLLPKNLRPIPSQEQLQKMLLKHWLKFDSSAREYDVINFFCDWFKAHFCRNPEYKEVENEDGKAIWLRYAVDVIYNQKWNGSEWL